MTSQARGAPSNEILRWSPRSHDTQTNITVGLRQRRGQTTQLHKHRLQLFAGVIASAGKRREKNLNACQLRKKKKQATLAGVLEERIWWGGGGACSHQAADVPVENAPLNPFMRLKRRRQLCRSPSRRPRCRRMDAKCLRCDVSN